MSGLSADLAPLVQVDELASLKGFHVGGYLHRDHRWALPLIRDAQLRGSVPTPTRLILFDAHHDALPPRNDSWVGGPYDISIPGLIALCRDRLSTLDDDRITAGMEVGLISDAVVFGVHDTFRLDALEHFVDSRGVSHRFHFSGLPGHALGYQGALSDIARRSELDDLWVTLGWNPHSMGSGFVPDRDPFVLGFDLDCFSFPWQDYMLAWPEEVWEGEFLSESRYSTTLGWTGASWTRALAEKAGLVMICREPGCCGGEAKADANFAGLSRHVFENRLDVSPI